MRKLNKKYGPISIDDYNALKKRVEEFNEEQNKEMKKASKGKSSSSSTPKGPAIKRPSYSTKARK